MTITTTKCLALITFVLAACGGGHSQPERPVIENVPPDAAPVEITPPAGPTGAEACDAYLREVEALARCESIPDESRESMRQAAEGMRKAFSSSTTSTPETLVAANEACEQARFALRQAAESLGCPLAPATP